MARKTQLIDLVADLRAETNRSQNVSVGVAEQDNLKYLLRRSQKQLYENYDWAFLRVERSVDLQAGQRYYDLPSDLDFDRLEDVALFRNGEYTPITYGIRLQDYTSYDSNNDERSEPARKWDIRNTGSGEQLEIWPIPSGDSQKLYFLGTRNLNPLIQEDDRADLDDTLIVLYAAHEMLLRQKSADAPAKKAAFDSHLDKLRGNQSSIQNDVRMGLGSPDKNPYSGTTIVVT